MLRRPQCTRAENGDGSSSSPGGREERRRRRNEQGWRRPDGRGRGRECRGQRWHPSRAWRQDLVADLLIRQAHASPPQLRDRPRRLEPGSLRFFTLIKWSKAPSVSSRPWYLSRSQDRIVKCIHKCDSSDIHRDSSRHIFSRQRIREPKVMLSVEPQRTVCLSGWPSLLVGAGSVDGTGGRCRRLNLRHALLAYVLDLALFSRP